MYIQREALLGEEEPHGMVAVSDRKTNLMCGLKLCTSICSRRCVRIPELAKLTYFFLVRPNLAALSFACVDLVL